MSLIFLFEKKSYYLTCAEKSLRQLKIAYRKSFEKGNVRLQVITDLTPEQCIELGKLDGKKLIQYEKRKKGRDHVTSIYKNL